MLVRVRPSAARLALTGLVGVFLVGTAAFATAAEQVHQMGPFALASDGASQLSSSAYSFDIWTDGVLRPQGSPVGG
jgi:hypothetical protein